MQQKYPVLMVHERAWVCVCVCAPFVDAGVSAQIIKKIVL